MNTLNMDHIKTQAERWLNRKPRTHEEKKAFMESLWNALEAAGSKTPIADAAKVECILYKTYGPGL